MMSAIGISQRATPPPPSRGAWAGSSLIVCAIDSIDALDWAGIDASRLASISGAASIRSRRA